MKKFAFCLFTLSLCIGTAATAQSFRGDGRNNERHDNRYDNRQRDTERLPRQYLRQRYVFKDWRERGLKKPAAGQRWVQVCDAFILAASRSGRIAEVHVAGQGKQDHWNIRDLNCRGRR